MTDENAADDDRRRVERYLRTRSEADFLALYDRNGDALYRFAARLCGGSGAEAEELSQETWLRALEGLPRFRFGAKLGTWLCSIALNRWRETCRAAGRMQNYEVIQGGLSRPMPAPGAETVALERAMAALPEGARVVLLLHDLEGYTHEEIAAALDIAEGTSKSQLHRARALLREALGGERGATA